MFHSIVQLYLFSPKMYLGEKCFIGLIFVSSMIPVSPQICQVTWKKICLLISMILLKRKLQGYLQLLHSEPNQKLEIDDTLFLLKHDISRCAFLFFFFWLCRVEVKKKKKENLLVLKLICHSNTNQSINLSFSVNLLLYKDIVKRHRLRLRLQLDSTKWDRVVSLYLKRQARNMSADSYKDTGRSVWK